MDICSSIRNKNSVGKLGYGGATLPPPVSKAEKRSVFVLLLIFAIITAALGFIALAGWFFEWTVLANFGPGFIPMAPSTALLFLLLGVAIGVRASTPLNHRVYVAIAWVACLVALLALLLLVLSVLGIRWKIEHLGLNAGSMDKGMPAGHMSPVTAFCFLLACGSFLASHSRSTVRRWRSALALGSAGGVLGISFIFLLTYFFGTPLLFGGSFIPPAINTILAFVALALALIVLAGRSREFGGAASVKGPRKTVRFLLIFGALAIGIITIGYGYWRNQERLILLSMEQSLSAIEDIKVDELAHWRRDRLEDSSLLFQNASISDLVRRALEQPADAEAQHQILRWIENCRIHSKYDRVCLLDAQGVVRLSVPEESAPMSAYALQRITAVLRSGQADFIDFHRNESNPSIKLGVVVPVFDEQEGRRILGAFYLGIDPETHLYPSIQHFPTSSQTAEMLLLRRDGDDALYLNELRHRANAALSFRLPLTQTEVPAVRAVLGQAGVISGKDYRGMPVIAIARAVPDSPWVLITKMDTAEILAPLWERVWKMLVLIAVFLVGVGGCVGTVITLADVSEQKALNVHLREAFDRAEEANRTKSEFLATMSHELRTPLNGVLGFAELLSDTQLDKEQQEYLRTISSSGNHLLAVVNDILDFSSIDKTGITLEPAPAEIAALVESSCLLVRKTALDKGLEFRCETTPRVPEQIICDERRIRQILINLLGNAVKFTSNGSIVLSIDTVTEGAKRFLDFSVKDTGIGISPEMFSQLFQPFIQANSSLHRPFGGTGLGLAISKRLAEAMGGSLTVTSTIGKGSTFTFQLPLEVPASTISDSVEKAPIEPEPETPPQRGMVLVVDDDQHSRTIAVKMLQSLGYRAECATDGAEAVKKFQSGKYHAILMDLSMPVMDGLDATRKIRKLEIGSRVPIIAFTANVLRGELDQRLAAGMDYVLTKPFKKSELATILAGVPARS